MSTEVILHKSCPLQADSGYPRTIEVIDLKSIGVLPFVPDRNLDDLTVAVPDLCRGLLGYPVDDLGIPLREPSEESGNTLRESKPTNWGEGSTDHISSRVLFQGLGFFEEWKYSTGLPFTPQAVVRPMRPASTGVGYTANFVMSFDLPLAGPNLEPLRAEGRCIDSSSGSIDQSPPFPASGGEAGHRLQRRRAPFVLAVGGVDNAIERCLFLPRRTTLGIKGHPNRRSVCPAPAPLGPCSTLRACTSGLSPSPEMR